MNIRGEKILKTDIENIFKTPLLRVLVVAVVIAMLVYMPTREFLKTTFMLGIPFIFLLGFMVKQPRNSIRWVILAVLVLSVVGGYVYMLTQLPERIEVRRIITEGSGLVAEGKYDAAIAEYRKLEKLDNKIKMAEKIEEVEKEKRAHRDVQLAQQLIKAGDNQEARKMLKAIPGDTRAAGEAKQILKTLPD